MRKWQGGLKFTMASKRKYSAKSLVQVSLAMRMLEKKLRLKVLELDKPDLALQQTKSKLP